ncbi:MAG: Ig-like domain-containing protein [Patescibacteria group bacterium]|nr:Ig-like domain-containing protein [Patescibacteria group bacterium]
MENKNLENDIQASSEEENIVSDDNLKNLKNSSKSRKNKFSSKIVLGTVFLFLIMILSVSAYFFLSKNTDQAQNIVNNNDSVIEEDLFDGFSKLIISADHVDDNFSLEAKSADSIGVDSDSSYILKSKEKLSIGNIKENLKIEPDVDYDLKEINNQEWEINPKDDLVANTLVQVALVASYTDEEGEKNKREYSWAFQVKDTFKLINSIPRNAAMSVPLNSGIEITFSHENFLDYTKYFSIEPKVSGRFEVHSRTLVFVPAENFTAGAIYTVKIKKGLPLKDSNETLKKDYSFTFETRNTSQYGSNSNIGIYNRMMEFNVADAPMIEISRYNNPNHFQVDLFQFKNLDDYLESIKERDKLPWWSYAKENFLSKTDNLHKVSSFGLDLKTDGQLKYIEFPSALDKGLYLAEIEANDKKIQVWIQISNLAVYYNMTKTDTIVWVNNIISEAPAEGAKIEMIGLEKKSQTNNEGVAVFGTPQELIKNADNKEKTERYYMKIFQGDDVLILPASRVSKNYWWTKPLLSDDYWIYLYTDRPRYQSTDTIKYWGVLKDRDNNKIDEDIKIILYKRGYFDYYYQPVKIIEQEIKLTEDGSYMGEINLKNLKPDYYTLELQIGDKVVKSKYISVKPYTKPAYSLSLIPEKTIAYAGEEQKFKASAAFFEGTPVPDLKLKFIYPGGEKKVITDENGEVELKFTKDYYDCHSDYGCWPDYEYFSIEPEESELAELKTGASVRFFGPKVYADVKTTYPEEGMAEIEIKSKYYDLEKLGADNWWRREGEDDPASQIKIEAEIYKTRYEKKETGTRYDFINKKTYKTYSYTKHEEKVKDLSFTTDEFGNYIFQQKVEPESYYKIKLKIFDQDGRYERKTVHLYYYNGRYINRYSSWSYNYFHFQFSEENEKYKLGDLVSAEFVKNDEAMPERENGYLFLQLQNGLQEYNLGDKGLYKFNFQKDDVPNVNLAGIYFNGRSYLSTQAFYHGRSVSFDINERRLKIMVEPDKEKYLPGENVTLNLKVLDKDDNPKQAEVNLNLVDEAYYAVANDSASPLETLYAKVRSGSLLTEQSHESLLDSRSGVEGGGCFLAGTLILMADNSLKPIEEVKDGEKIKTFSNPFDKEQVEGEVTEVWEHVVGEYLIINDNLKITPEHQIYSNYRFVDAGLLKKGDWLLNNLGEKIYINSIEIKFKYISVYNLRIDPQHTFFADGFYVHNQEKGGGARELFTDAALFDSIQTNAQGEGKISFKLPDNITSWRITAQAITKDLYAGLSVTQIPVSLPVFAEITIDDEYLREDKPIARMRSFGTALENNDMANFSISSESLNINEEQNLSALAFKPVYFPLPELSLGDHKIIYGLKTEKGDDAIKLPLKVIESRLSSQKAINNKLSLDTKIVPPNDLPFAVVLIDQGQNELYPPLTSLSWSWGDRLDQKLSRKMARILLEKYYDEDFVAPDFNAQNYQLSSGGISLLPYSSEDLELSMHVAQLGGDEFDEEALSQYFLKFLKDKNLNREEATFALCGLAAIGKPVLTRIKKWVQKDDLSLKEKIYLSLALSKAGDKELSRKIYYEILENYGEEKLPHIIIKSGEKLDDTFQTTALTAVLASSLGAKEASGMLSYLLENQKLYGQYRNSENLFNLEKIDYIQNALPNLSPESAKIVFEIEGTKNSVEITGGRTYAFELSPDFAQNVKFLEIEGDVGISLRYTDVLDMTLVERDNNLDIRREYYVNNKKTNNFSEKDLIEVRLYPSFSSSALAGSYQITDILPSALMPVTKFYYQNSSYDCHYWYPYNQDGQMIKYRISRDWKNSYCGGDYIKYYARAKNRGEYVAESAIIQSFKNPDFINYSTKSKIIISE